MDNITAAIKPGDDDGEVFAQVTVKLDEDQEVTFVVHRSKVYARTINVEIDGDLTTDAPALRINLNDQLVFDSVLGLPAVPDEREPDLE